MLLTSTSIFYFKQEALILSSPKQPLSYFMWNSLISYFFILIIPKLSRTEDNSTIQPAEFIHLLFRNGNLFLILDTKGSQKEFLWQETPIFTPKYLNSDPPNSHPINRAQLSAWTTSSRKTNNWLFWKFIFNPVI